MNPGMSVLVTTPPLPSLTMLAPSYLDMPPLLLDQSSHNMQPPPGSFMGSLSAASYQKSKRSWLHRLQPGKERARAPQLHPAAMLHRDYLQEYREKYGALSPEHHGQLMVDPWHMGSVRHHIHPAVVASAGPNTPQYLAYTTGICACPGTKKLGKPCKTCGRRVAGVNKGGTVRGGTVRGGTKVRPALNIPPPPTPTIAPMRLRPTPTSPQDEKKSSRSSQCDPYDMMRRSRLSLQEKQTGSLRARSKSLSPTRARLSFPPTVPLRTTSDEHRSRLDEWVVSNDTPPQRSRSNSSSEDSSDEREKRKSILECDVSAYELISKYLNHNTTDLQDGAESDDLSDNAILDDEEGHDEEKVINKKISKVDTWNNTIPTTIPRVTKNRNVTISGQKIMTSSSKFTSKECNDYITSDNEENSLSHRTNSMPVLPQSDDEIENIIIEEKRAPTPKPPPRKRRIKKSSVIKSILKKSSFSSAEDTSPLSSLHIPTYQEFKQRKKQVQFKSNNDFSDSNIIVKDNNNKGKSSSKNNDLASLESLKHNGLKQQNEIFTTTCDGERPPPIPPPLPTQSSISAASSTGSVAVSEVSTSEISRQEKLLHSDVVKDYSTEEIINKHGPPSQELERTSSSDDQQITTTSTTTEKPKSKPPKRREGGSIVHIRGDHHKLFLDTMRLRMASQHRRGDSRVAFATSTPISGRMLSPTRPRDPPPPPPPSPPSKPQSWTPTSDVVIVTSPEINTNSTIVTVNETSVSEESDYNTLRINIGNENLATILTVSGNEVEKIIDNNNDNTSYHNYDHIESVKRNVVVPHVCSKGQVTISDTSIIEKVENKRRTNNKNISLIESPYVSTSIKVGPITNDNNNKGDSKWLTEPPYVSTSIIVGNENKLDKKWPEYETNITIDSTKDDNSITDDESAIGSRSKFYVTVEDEDEDYDDEEIEDHYEMIRDPIYEEIKISEPQAKSIFEGASKYDILNYLVGAKERGIPLETTPTREVSLLDLPALEDRPQGDSELGGSSAPSELVSHVSDSSEDAIPLRSSPAKSRRSSAEIERNDSGVGSETSQSSRSRWLMQRRGHLDQGDLQCEDCEQSVEPQVTDSGVVYAPLVCRKCGKRRSERREIISELLETELKYGRDLRIMAEEFYRPMLVAGLLSQEQLDAIFLNVPELLEVSRQIAEKLQDAVDIALDQGDEDLQTVNVGRLILECSHMLHAFETYCTRQGSASVLLSSLEKEKELLKIFLRVSQMENAVLRRMNLNSFLMVPVQRVTKYPLLLARLYKATPPHHEARELLKQAQQKIESQLEHMNAEAKDLSTTKLWRRISIISVPYRRNNAEPDLNIRLRKLALEVLGWSHEEAQFVMEGRLLFTQPTDSNWRKGRTIKLSHLNALLVTHGKAGERQRPEDAMAADDDVLTFPRDSGVQEASLLLLKDKAGRCSLLREPLFLDKCIICAELQDIEDCFEVQEIPTRDTFIFKAEDMERTREWFRRLQFHAQSLGGWRRRRNALANIMMNGMVPRS